MQLSLSRSADEDAEDDKSRTALDIAASWGWSQYYLPKHGGATTSAGDD
jgi:hypothetical protein